MGKQAGHGRGNRGGRAGAAAHAAIPPPADAPRVRRHPDLDEIGLDPSVGGIRRAATLTARLGRRQFHPFDTHRQRLARRPGRPRTAGLLTPPARRRRPRLPLAAIAEPVPGVVRAHRLQQAQLPLQLRNPARQPAGPLRSRQGLPQDRILLTHRNQLSAKCPILLAQRHHRRAPARIHRQLFEKPPQTRRLGHRRQRPLRLLAKRTQLGPRLFQLLLVAAVNARQRTRPATRRDRLPAPICRAAMTTIAARCRQHIPGRRQHHRIRYRMPIHASDITQTAQCVQPHAHTTGERLQGMWQNNALGKCFYINRLCEIPRRSWIT